MSQGATPTRSVKRLAVIAEDATSLLRQREEFLADVLARRHGVLTLVPESSRASIAALEARGFAAATYPMASSKPQFIADGRTVGAIAATLADRSAHVVLAAGVKSLLLGAQAARKASVGRCVGLVTALPPEMRGDPSSQPTWSWRRTMKAGFRALDAAVFHSDADRRRLSDLGILPAGVASIVVPGAGVDLVRHGLQPLPPLIVDGVRTLNFLMIARKDAAKGVVEFCRAAGLVKARAPDTRFILAGPDGDLDRSELAQFGGHVRILDDQADVRPLIGASHVVVVPSWADAMPRILLEALAAGRPVIATDIPGCREAVDERVNGVLVPPRDAAALADAMMSFLKRPDLVPAMSRASRAKAERRFAVGPVNAALLDVLGL